MIPVGHNEFGNATLQMAKDSGLFSSLKLNNPLAGPISPSASIHCCICLSGGDRKGDIVIAIAIFAFSFFVGLAYTINSLKDALHYGEFAHTAKSKLKGLESPDLINLSDFPDPFNSSFVDTHQGLAPTPSAPSLDSLSPIPHDQEVFSPPLYPSLEGTSQASPPLYPYLGGTTLAFNEKETYSAAYGVLTELKRERLITALCQGLMTVGAGALTVALIMALLNDSHRLALNNTYRMINQLAIGGGSAVGLGAIGYGVKYLVFPTRHGKMSYQKLLEFPRV